MEKLKEIKCALVEAVQEQVKDLKHANTTELDKAIDMIHHLEEAMYYCSIIQAMEDTKNQEYGDTKYYKEGRSAYPSGMMGGKRMYEDWPGHDWDDRWYYTPYMEYAPYMMRDKEWREDKLAKSRRTYIEGKITHSKDVDSMQDLEHYIKDLGDDLTDMIQHSSPEEKQLLSNKLQLLASKVNK